MQSHDPVSPLTRVQRSITDVDRIHRYTALVAAAELIPVPLADTWVQNRLRRRLVRGECPALDDATVKSLADERIVSPMRIVTWPVRRMFRMVAAPLTIGLTARQTWKLGYEARGRSSTDGPTG